MANEYGTYQDAWRPDNTSMEFGGVVRLLAAGPDILSDGPHVARGLQSTYIDASGYLVVEHDGAEPVGTAIIQIDETLAARGVICGPSVGGSSTRIRFYRVGTGLLDLNNATHYGYVSGTSSNIWIYFNFPLNRGNGSPTLDELNAAAIEDLQSAVAALQSENDELNERVAALETFHPILIFDETEFA